MTSLVFKIDYFQVWSMVHSFFQLCNVLGEEGYSNYESFVVKRTWQPEVYIRSFLVLASTGGKWRRREM